MNLIVGNEKLLIGDCVWGGKLEIEKRLVELKTACLKGAEEIYGSPLPESVNARLEKEFEELATNEDMLRAFLSLWNVYKALEPASWEWSIAGVLGNSLIAYVLKFTNIDPLEFHLDERLLFHTYDKAPIFEIRIAGTKQIYKGLRHVTLVPGFLNEQLSKLEKATGVKPDSISREDSEILALFKDEDALLESGIELIGEEPFISMAKDYEIREFADVAKVFGLVLGSWEEGYEPLSAVKANPSSRESLIATKDDIFEATSQAGEENKLPSWVEEAMDKALYLFPRAHCLMLADMVWKLLWYKKNYSEEFFVAYER